MHLPIGPTSDGLCAKLKASEDVGSCWSRPSNVTFNAYPGEHCRFAVVSFRPPPSSPLYLVNAAIYCSSSSSTCLSQLPAATLPSAGWPETPRASSVTTSAKRMGSSSATTIRSVSVRPAVTECGHPFVRA